MQAKHLLLLLLTVLIWGMNFVVIRVGLNGIPPLLLCAVRFGLASLPGVFVLPRPKAPFKFIIGYGLFTFALQFGFLFTGINLGVPPGLASLILQVQVFFSIALSAMIFGDRPSPWKIIGALISFIGVAIVAVHLGGSVLATGLILTLSASFCWSVGNMFSKKVDASSALSLVVWGSLVALPFMILLSLAVEGPQVIVNSFRNISLTTVAAVLYLVYLSTLIGYGAWGFLLNKYSTAVVVPFTLLIPVIGFISSAVFLGEELPSWKLWASLFVMIGLTFNLLEAKLRRILVR